MTPWLGREPRACQVAAYALAMDGLRSRRADVMRLVTGAGKSYIQAECAATVLASPRLSPGDYVGISVPTEALVEQMHATVAARIGAARVGMWYGRRKQARDVIITCVPSIPTLVTETQGRRCVAWIADEVHRGLDTPATIALLAPLTRVGFTATPWRTDEPIEGWDRVAYDYGLADGVRDGVILRPEVATWTGDADTDADTALIEMLRQRPPEGPGIVSAYDVADAETFAARLSAELGLRATHISGYQPKAVRARLLADLEAGRLDCLVHVRLLTEGVDLPWLRWLGARQLRTPLGQVQEVGRIMRAIPGKPRPVVYDPHNSGLEAFNTPSRLGEIEAREAAEAVAAAPAERRRVIPLAQCVLGASAFARRLWDSAQMLGLPVSPVMGDRGRQRERASERQVAALLRAANERIAVPDPARTAIKAIAPHAAALDVGTASRLLSVIAEARKRRAQSAARVGWPAAWAWPDTHPTPGMDPDEIAALRDISSHGG